MLNKNITFQKLQNKKKNPKIYINCRGRPETVLEAFLRTGTSGSAWVHAPPPLAARESTRHRRKNGQPVDLAPLCFLFLSSPAGTPTVTCKHTKTQSTAVDFNFSLLLQICVFSLLLSFGSASLWLQVRPLMLSRR